MKQNLKNETVRHLINSAVNNVEGAFVSFQKDMNESSFARSQAILSREEDGGLDAIAFPELSIIQMEGAVEAMREAVNSGSLAEEVSRRLRFRKRAIATAIDEATGIERVIEFTRFDFICLVEDGGMKYVQMIVGIRDDLYYPL